ncbi:hypothetical protein BDN72DRAFT_494495 [Pluteus cervinus]|uniref:Uncharacterized protein n=1 Tax=Pluteus cervinus TaxID=181527 RepID=A0ACD3A4X0_9AGAR|nr:hypothetical protein BDN72DRAFT_494495 [Pluteus cervinus]
MVLSLPRDPEPNHGLYKISRSTNPGGISRLVSIVPVDILVRSVHLFPSFGAIVPASRTSSNVLEECTTFFVNPFTDPQLYSKFV